MKSVMLSAAIAAMALTGCNTLPVDPIKTTLDLQQTDTGFPALKYASEKDVIYLHTVTDPETGVIESRSFQALASAPAMEQAKRDALAAQVQLEQARLISDSLRAVTTLAGGNPVHVAPADSE